jgi:hypothetical protein
MQNVIENTAFDLTNPEVQKNKTESSPLMLDYGDVKGTVKNNFLNEVYNPTSEDSSQLIGNLLIGRKFIAHESWKKINTIQARIVSFDNDKVYVDFLLESKKRIF